MTPSGALSYTFSSGSSTVNPPVNSSYSVTGTSSAGCVTTLAAISNVTVYVSPTISVPSGSICSGQVFTITPSGAATYTFSSGTATVMPLSTTSYTVIGSGTAACNSLPVICTVTVEITPTIAVNSGSICDGQTFTIAPSGANSYTFSNGSNTITPAVTTTYSVTGTSTAGCISVSPAIGTVTVEALPTVTVSDGTICAGGSFTIVPSGASTYSYSSGPVVSPVTTTSYSVTGTSGAGCTATLPAVCTVTVFASPTLTINATDSTVCEGRTVNITASGAVNYSWNGISNGVPFAPTASMNYSVQGTDVNGCTSSGTIFISVRSNPVVSITPSGTVFCAGETVTLQASGATSYTWSTGPVKDTIIIKPMSAVSLTVTGTGANGCGALTIITLTVDPCDSRPVAVPVWTANTCSGRNNGRIGIEITSPYANTTAKYVWSGNRCPGQDCAILDSLPVGKYSATVIVTYTVNANLVKTDTLNVLYIDLPDPGACELHIFTGLSPNGDHLNDTWKIDNIDLYPNNQVTIFNRWGTAIATIKGYDNKSLSWPQPGDISKLPASTYFYVIDRGNGSAILKGWIELTK
jgi:gliding motility-associated-like protein